MTSGFSRRQLLTVTGLAVGTAWVEVGSSASPAAAAPAAGQLTLEPVANDPVPLLSALGSAPEALPRHLAVRIRGDNVALVAGAQVKVAFDKRFFSPLATPLITLAGQRLPATATTEQDPTTGQRVITLTLGADVPATAVAGGELIALLGTANPHAYPHDLAIAPSAVAADLTTGAHSARRDLKRSRPSSFGGAAKPWGVEVGAGWAKQTWGPDGQYWYWYPVIASVAGRGPGRTPAADLAVTVDPQVVESIGVASARLNQRPYAASKIRKAESTATGTLRRVRWRTDVRLAPGDQLDVILKVSTRSPSGALETITHPVVATGMGLAPAARHTGLTSVSRTDSAWQ